MLTSEEKKVLKDKADGLARGVVRNIASDLFNFLNLLRNTHVEGMAINKIPSKQRTEFSDWCKSIFKINPGEFKRNPEDYPVDEDGVYQTVLRGQLERISSSNPFEKAKLKLSGDDSISALAAMIQRSVFIVTDRENGVPKSEEELRDWFDNQLKPVLAVYMESISEKLMILGMVSLDNDLKGNIFKFVDMLLSNGFLSEKFEEVVDIRKGDYDAESVYLWILNILKPFKDGAKSSHPMALIWDIPALISTLDDIKDNRLSVIQIEPRQFIRLRISPTATAMSTKSKPILMFYDSDKNPELKENSEVMPWVRSLLYLMLQHRTRGLPLDWKINVMEHHPSKPIYTQPSNFFDRPPVEGYYEIATRSPLDDLKTQLKHWCNSFDAPDEPQGFTQQWGRGFSEPRTHQPQRGFGYNTSRQPQQGLSQDMHMPPPNALNNTPPTIDVFVIDVTKAERDESSGIYYVNPSLLRDIANTPPKITYLIKDVNRVMGAAEYQGDPDFGTFNTGDIFLEENGSF